MKNLTGSRFLLSFYPHLTRNASGRVLPSSFCERCGEIMGEYGAYQASMLDGGSSSVMVYKGREITSPTTLSQNEEGRTLPDAFLVK